MHEVAELGVAAHWVYKQGAAKTEGRNTAGCASCSTSSSTPSGPEEFLEHTKLEMFQDQVFCFTPKGDLIALPRGATPVDFAYAVHSRDRRHLRRRQDQRPPGAAAHRSSRTATRSRSSPRKAQTPSPTWERFVVTGKARARIRRFVRTQQRQQYLDLGKAILQKAFRQEGQEFPEKALEAVLKTFNCATVEDLYVAVGEGHRHRARGACTRSSRRKPRRQARQGRAARDARAASKAARRTRCRSAASSPAWRCISPAAATRCRATASSASSPPARASPSTPSTATRSRASPTRRSAGSTSPGTASGDAERPCRPHQRHDRQRARQPRQPRPP